MSDATRGNRPLSPHLTIYRFSLTMAMSILTRITGVGLILAAVMLVWWLAAAATGADAFAAADWVMTSWLGILVLVGSAAALWYHACNGIRHLFWDSGRGFDLAVLRTSGFAVLGGTAALTVLTLLIAFTPGN
jgi:succinate dehydrogenase / fumarate reductase cytochrome b subunit